MPPTLPERGFVGAEPTDPARNEPSLFASSFEEPRPRSGLSIWLAAAAALVIGIGIGFASGYRAGKGSTSVAATATENPAATSGATGGQPFSESAVQDPVKLNPEPIVVAPAPQSKERGLNPAAGPAPRRAPVAPAKPAAVAERPARVAEKPAPAEVPPTGPGSLEIVSRPAGAQVVLDGRPVGKTPMTIPDVSVGTHSIRLELAGFKGWATTVDVKAGIAMRVASSLEQ